MGLRHLQINDGLTTYLCLFSEQKKIECKFNLCELKEM